MLKRLVIGLLKGLVLGGAIGAGLQLGLHWTVTSGGILGFLLAMGAAGTTGVFAGKPPWRDGAWIEALLKGMVGVGAGALVYWLGSRYAPFELPLPLPGVTEPEAWTAMPVVFLPAIAGIYGSIVELDNTDADAKGGGKKSGGTAPPKTRVAVDTDSGLEETEHATSTKPARGRRT